MDEDAVFCPQLASEAYMTFSHTTWILKRQAMEAPPSTGTRTSTPTQTEGNSPPHSGKVNQYAATNIAFLPWPPREC